MKLAHFCLFGCAVLLGACASEGDKKEEHRPPKPAPVKTENLICPQTAILHAAQKAVDGAVQARLTGVDGDCAYRKDAIDLKFTLHMAARRIDPPFVDKKTTDFPIFVALLDPSDSLVARQILTASFAFSGTDPAMGVDMPLHVSIPLAKEAQPSGPDYRVLVGFQNPQEE